MEPSSPKLVADNPFEIPELYNVILQNTGSGDLAALMSTSRQMMTSADKLVSDYNRPLVGKILKSEEKTQKGNKHITNNDKVQYVDYLLWYWTLLDHRFLPLSVIWFEWAQATSFLPITTFNHASYKSSTLTMLATLAKEFYKALRRSPLTAAEMQTPSGLLSSSSRQLTTKDYEQIGLEGAVAFWRLPPDYHVDFQSEASIILLHLKPEVTELDVTRPEMSFGFDALVRSRLAYMGCLIYWIHQKAPESTYIQYSVMSHSRLLDYIGRKAKDDEENRTFQTICDHYAEGVIKMNKQATTAILSWRFDESAARKLQDSPYGDLNLLHDMVPLQLSLDRLTWDFLEARNMTMSGFPSFFCAHLCRIFFSVLFFAIDLRLADS